MVETKEDSHDMKEKADGEEEEEEGGGRPQT